MRISDWSSDVCSSDLIAKLLASSGLRRWLHVALDDTQAARLADCLAFFAPEVEVLVFPAWDCLPYDRVSPHRDIVARRLDVLTRLMQPVGAKKSGRPQVVVTTVNALLQDRKSTRLNSSH